MTIVYCRHQQATLQHLNYQIFPMYSDLMDKYELGDPKCLGWGSVSTQVSRFMAFDYLGVTNGASVLDVGSGFGDYYAYLLSKGYRGSYLGIEMINEFHEYACAKYGAEKFMCSDFSGFTSRVQFDYVVASGLFWLDTYNSDALLTGLIQKMFAISTKGIAFNLLSPYTKSRKKGLKYVDIGFVIAEISKLSQLFCIRHDYHPESKDYTCIIFKNN